MKNRIIKLMNVNLIKANIDGIDCKRCDVNNKELEYLVFIDKNKINWFRDTNVYIKYTGDDSLCINLTSIQLGNDTFYIFVKDTAKLK